MTIIDKKNQQSRKEAVELWIWMNGNDDGCRRKDLYRPRLSIKWREIALGEMTNTSNWNEEETPS